MNDKPEEKPTRGEEWKASTKGAMKKPFKEKWKRKNEIKALKFLNEKLLNIKRNLFWINEEEVFLLKFILIPAR